MQHVQWNAPSAPKLLSASRQRALPRRVVFEEQLVTRHHLCMWAARLLTDVSLLSHEHDTCTLLQMPPDGVPGLADVVQYLITTYALLDKHLEVGAPSLAACHCMLAAQVMWTLPVTAQQHNACAGRSAAVTATKAALLAVEAPTGAWKSWVRALRC